MEHRIRYNIVAKAICDIAPNYIVMMDSLRICKLDYVTEKGISGYCQYIWFKREDKESYNLSMIYKKCIHDDYQYMKEIVTYVDFTELKQTPIYTGLGIPVEVGIGFWTMKLKSIEYTLIARAICDDTPAYTYRSEMLTIYKLEFVNCEYDLQYKEYINFKPINREYHNINNIWKKCVDDDYLYMENIVNYVDFIALTNTYTYTRLESQYISMSVTKERFKERFIDFWLCNCGRLNIEQ